MDCPNRRAVGQQHIKVTATLAAAGKMDKASIEAAWELSICRAYRRPRSQP
jgi:hypothetical protein